MVASTTLLELGERILSQPSILKLQEDPGLEKFLSTDNSSSCPRGDGAQSFKEMSSRNESWRCSTMMSMFLTLRQEGHQFKSSLGQRVESRAT